MWLTGIASLEVFAALVAGVLAAVGAIVAFVLMAGVVQGGLAMAARFVTSRLHAQTDGQTVRAPGSRVVESRLSPMPDEALLSRQAWWRLRC